MGAAGSNPVTPRQAGSQENKAFRFLFASIIYDKIARFSRKKSPKSHQYKNLYQLGRRNIPKYVRGELILKLKPVIAEKAKEKEQERKTTFQKSEKSNMTPINTTKELARLAGVSHDITHKAPASPCERFYFSVNCFID